MFIDLLDNEATLVVDRTDSFQKKPNDFSTQYGLFSSIPDEEFKSLFRDQ